MPPSGALWAYGLVLRVATMVGASSQGRLLKISKNAVVIRIPMCSRTSDCMQRLRDRSGAASVRFARKTAEAVIKRFSAFRIIS